MLDPARLQRIRLVSRPLAQRVVAQILVTLDYRFPRPTEVVIEGLENLPADRPVFVAMNHTDRYNAFPFLCTLFQEGRHAATWVKGKYYESWFVGGFMNLTNQIPLASRGYVIAGSWAETIGRPLDGETYRLLRDVVDGEVPVQAALAHHEDVHRFIQAHGGQRFADEMEAQFAALMVEVVRLNREALELGLFVLVFPQGTRSIRLSKGHTGLAQVAQHMDVPIVPIGCSGSDRLYPGDVPFSKGGRVVYRVGKPLEPDGPELAAHRVSEDFVPLSRDAGRRHGAAFQAITDVVMDRINGLVDPPYQYAASGDSDGVQGTNRFL
jgi:1-acyl-sn-glycerol-3-phosphate acyltransferase